jgi:phenylalanine-4-hydroxylase
MTRAVCAPTNRGPSTIWRGSTGKRLIRQDNALKLYGAGIVSSPNRLGFDVRRLMRTKYRIDDYQQTYFVIKSFEDLLRQTVETDFVPLYAALAQEDDLETDTILPEDRVYTRGTQAHASTPPHPSS